MNLDTFDQFKEIDPAELRDEAKQKMIEDAFAAGAAVNLDEVFIDTVMVAIVEYEEVEINGKIVKKPYVRHAEISTFVPMALLNRMLASQKKLRKQLAKIEAGEMEEPDADLMLIWMQQQILGVWKLTEEDMTLARIENGLDFEKVQGLFARFFGETLAKVRKTNR